MIKPEPISAIPELTLATARAAFPKPSLYMRLRDEFGALYAQTNVQETATVAGINLMPVAVGL